MTDLFERIVEFAPAYDNRRKGYGIHGVELRMVLKGEKGAVQFLLFTNWHLPTVNTDSWEPFMLKPMPADLGYHSYKPMYEGHSSMGACCYLNNEECFYDGSGLNAGRIYNILLEKGSDGVWQELDNYYKETFK